MICRYFVNMTILDASVPWARISRVRTRRLLQMPTSNTGTGEGGPHYQNTLRLVLTVLLSTISVSAVIAFLALCYRSHWKAGALRAFPDEPQTVRIQAACNLLSMLSPSDEALPRSQIVQERHSPGIRAPFQQAIEIQHPDGCAMQS